MTISDTLATVTGAIGVFDSGVGGLSVLHSVRQALPAEPIIYVADSGYAPYGDRDPAWIQARSQQIVEFLMQQGCKAILIACNTATVIAAQQLRQQYTLPIIAIEPAVKPAASLSKNGVIALMATQRTVDSPQLESLCQRYAPGQTLIRIACPGLAERVEQGEQDSPELETYLRHKLAPAIAQQADTLILGCTHYPFLLAPIERITAGSMRIIEPSFAVAAQVQRRLDAGNLRLKSAAQGPLEVWSSSPVTIPTLRRYLKDPTLTVHLLPSFPDLTVAHHHARCV